MRARNRFHVQVHTDGSPCHRRTGAYCESFLFPFTEARGGTHGQIANRFCFGGVNDWKVGSKGVVPFHESDGHVVFTAPLRGKVSGRKGSAKVGSEFSEAQIWSKLEN